MTTKIATVFEWVVMTVERADALIADSAFVDMLDGEQWEIDGAFVYSLEDGGTVTVQSDGSLLYEGIE